MDGLGQQVRFRITFATLAGMFFGIAFALLAVAPHWSNGAWCLGIAAFFMWLATKR